MCCLRIHAEQRGRSSNGCADVVFKDSGFLGVNHVELRVRHRDNGQIVPHLSHEDRLGYVSVLLDGEGLFVAEDPQEGMDFCLKQVFRQMPRSGQTHVAT